MPGGWAPEISSEEADPLSRAVSVLCRPRAAAWVQPPTPPLPSCVTSGLASPPSDHDGYKGAPMEGRVENTEVHPCPTWPVTGEPSGEHLPRPWGGQRGLSSS